MAESDLAQALWLQLDSLAYNSYCHQQILVFHLTFLKLFETQIKDLQIYG